MNPRALRAALTVALFTAILLGILAATAGPLVLLLTLFAITALVTLLHYMVTRLPRWPENEG